MAKRNANQKKLVSLCVFAWLSVRLFAQVSDIGWQNGGVQGLTTSDSFIYVNEITAEELVRHPLLTVEEGMRILQHRTQFGEILDLMELRQCRFGPERLLELRPYLVFSPSSRLARAEWFRAVKSPLGNHSYSNTYYPYRIQSTPHSLGGAWGHSMQFRWNKGEAISFGGSLQLDPGERMSGWQFPFRQWHFRLGHIPVGRKFEIQKFVLGRYNLQLGQGLVQGGLSGFWNAPMLWARKSPDWDLAEKRGFDEYRGHSGVAIGFSFDAGKRGIFHAIRRAPLRTDRIGALQTIRRERLSGGKIEILIAGSWNRVSARIDTLGRIQSLITDGLFTTESAMRWYGNTRQMHGTLAMQYVSGRRCTYGVSWSGYGYSRPWNAVGEWVDLTPALRAGVKFNYPQLWCTHYQKSGGMWFFNSALELQPLPESESHSMYQSPFQNQSQHLSQSKSTRLSPMTNCPFAWVVGYVKPLGKTVDLSLRFYVVHRNFRPPQGLFNEFQQNHKRLSITLSSNPNHLWVMKYGAELGKNLRYNEAGEKPVTVIYQLGALTKPYKGGAVEILWQLRHSGDIASSANAGQYSGTSWSLGGNEQNALTWNRSQNSVHYRSRLSLVLSHRPASGWAVVQKISLLPSHPLLYPSTSKIAAQTTAATIDQINPITFKNSILFAMSVSYRKPFQPLKITLESLCYQSNSPLYHQPTTTATEIANYVLSGQGYGINCLLEYAVKCKRPSVMKQKTPQSKTSKSRVQTAFRAEFLHKNNSQFPNQPRIFVSLCWK